MTYFSNLPTLLSGHDFQARHSDMLAAARCEPLTKEQVVAMRKVNPYVYDKATRSLLPNAKMKAAIWQAMREHLEKNPVINPFLGIDMAKPGSDRTVIVTKLPKAVWRKWWGQAREI